jgi:hypothetical protein
MKKHGPRGLIVLVAFAVIGVSQVCFGAPANASPSPTALATASIINTQVFVIAVPRNVALDFSSGNNLAGNPADGLKELKQAIRVDDAESISNPSVTSKDGERGVVDDGVTRLEATPASASPGGTLQVSVYLAYKNKKLWSDVQSKSGEIRFLGTFDSTDTGKALTYFVFVILRAVQPEA